MKLKIILEQALDEIKNSFVLILLITLSLAAGLFLILGSVSYYNESEKRLESFRTAYNDDEIRFATFFRDTGGLSDIQNDDLIKTSILTLSKEEDFQYYFFNRQTIYIAGYQGRDSCLDGFEEGRPRREEYTIDSIAYSGAKAYFASPGIFEKFSLKISEGKDYSDDEKSAHSETEMVPVVMGAKYAGCYHIGDVISCMLINQDKNVKIKIKISGFLIPGSTILEPSRSETSDMLALDYVILIPPIYMDGITEFNACDGIAVTTDHKYNFYNYYEALGLLGTNESLNIVWTPSMKVSAIFFYEANKYFNALLKASILILISTTVCMTINLTNRVMSNFRKYAIHLISGATLRGIKAFLAVQTIMIIFVANIIAFITAAIFGNDVFTFEKTQIFGVGVAEYSGYAISAVFGASVLVGLFSIIPAYIKLSTVEFDSLLRGRE